MVALYVRNPRQEAAGRFDALGFVYLSVAIAAFQIVLDRGETDDWFSSTVIITSAIIAGLCFFLFLVQIFFVPHPFVRPRLFADINFSIGVFLNLVVGVVLMGTMALFPPLLQSLLNFPIVTVGLLLAPRGVGTMCAMFLVGRLAKCVQPRFLMLLGFLLTAAAMHGMSRFSLQIGPSDVLLYGLLQGFGLGFIFPVLVSTSFSTLPRERRVEAAGIYNLLRNIGSSAGISIMTALITYNTQINHALIGARVTPFSHLPFQAPYFLFYNPYAARGLAFLNDQVTLQAGMIAYLDDFKLMMLILLVTAPLCLFMRTATTSQESKKCSRSMRIPYLNFAKCEAAHPRLLA